MTFSCPNFDFNSDNLCMKLNSECIPGRPGCLLFGKVKLSEPVKARLAELAEETKLARKNG